MNTQVIASVRGSGLAELSVPSWLRILHLSSTLGIFFFVLSIAFFAMVLITRWAWVGTASVAAIGFVSSLCVTMASGCAWLWFTKGPTLRILNLRKDEAGKTVWGGWGLGLHGISGPAVVVALMALLFVALEVMVTRGMATFPLPRELVRATVEVAPPPTSSSESGPQPIYFWDYATWFDPAWLDQFRLLVPYEQGPPQKLLSKIFFEDAATHEVVLELHGKRPRWYSTDAVETVFRTRGLHPADWRLLWQLQREAGLTAPGRQLHQFWFAEVTQKGGAATGTRLIGIPWLGALGSRTELTGEHGVVPLTSRVPFGQFFFWGPDGSVFQVRCPSQCALSRALELVSFPADPRGSASERIRWTQERLKKLLTAPRPADKNTRIRHENLLSIYLVSLLTLDPRDPETFFHLGKLAHNAETVFSAIRYGRDLGLEAEKIAELEAVAQDLNH